MSEMTREMAHAGKYLTFAVGTEEFGIEILKVKEIIGYQEVTEVPQTPPEVKGVLNLRGQVIPVVSLRQKFGMEEKEITDETCILVVEIGSDERTVFVGIIVDSVSEVQDIRPEQIEPSPAFGESKEVEFITGMAKIGKAVKILLDIEKVLAGCNLTGF
ncbi:MAG: purine-binding chemotaxis protein CheW [Sedimentisphaerales bacterium]|nr:purine-binding chemotaxis protein CheW [Sedimentisphaerales bacterium]